MGSSDILIRKARSNYVCVTCGHKINKGEEYIDKVFFAGKFVTHQRYHDVCPKKTIAEKVTDLLIKHDFEVPVILNNQKYWMIGIVDKEIILRCVTKNLMHLKIQDFKHLKVIE